MDGVFRDLRADLQQKHWGKPCQWCSQPIRWDSYSCTDGSMHCSKLCGLMDAGLLSTRDLQRIENSGRTAPPPNRINATNRSIRTHMETP